MQESAHPSAPNAGICQFPQKMAKKFVPKSIVGSDA
jgi:hypothetical protein